MRTSPRTRAAAARTLTAAAVLAVAATACTTYVAPPSGKGGGSAGAAGPGVVPGTSTTLHWHDCPGQSAGGGQRCASLRVPVDYSKPDGRKITLALSMVPATAPKSEQQGVMLVNPGGPGASGLSLASSVAQQIDPGVAAKYDIVGFDPRGVGSSVPALSCDPSFFKGVRPDYIPASSSVSAQQPMINRAKSYAQGCGKRFGWLLPYMTTQNSARDMDSIRQAFGVAKISYYAFSYGTYIGQVYGTLFPGRVRRMVLDSTVDPTGVWWSDNIGQDYAFQGRMEAFFAWTAKNNAAYHLGSTAAQVRANWYKMRGLLKANPVTVGGKPQIGADEYDDTFLLGGYLNTLWPWLAQAMSEYLSSGGSATSVLVSQYQANGVQDENEFAVYNAVQCSDVEWPRSWAYWNSQTRKVYQKARFQGWDNAWYNAACAFWPVKAPAKPLRINGKGLPPVLMLQGTLDAATPYAGAQRAHQALPSARMVVVQGGGNHGQSLASPPNECVQNYLNSYLDTGAVPDRPGSVNATCPSVPDPSPGG